MRFTLFLFLISFSAHAFDLTHASDDLMPTFRNELLDDSKAMFFEPQTMLQSVRVKIFPHNGVYSAPQGREKIQSTVSLHSQGPCRVEQNNVPTLNAKLTLESLAGKTLRFDCESPIQVVREKGLESYLYGGRIEAQVVGQTVQLINEIPFEEYVKGVVPAEMPSYWHIEALKAQAIAARTYAVFQIQQKHFDFDDTIQYQAYLGQSWQRPSTNSAVDETAGLVMTYNSKLIVSYFSADSGGYTEQAKNIWGDRFDVPYTPSKPEVYDPSAFKTAWLKNVSFLELSNGFISRLGFPKSTRVLNFKIKELTESGRALWIEVYLQGENSPRRIWGEDFRRAARLKSTLFEVSLSKDGTSVQFQGRGFGHGVGMNQTGAYIMARDLKWTYDQILKFYYEGIEFSR